MYLKYITYLISYSIYLSKYGKTTLTMYLTFKYLISVVKYTQSDLACIDIYLFSSVLLNSLSLFFLYCVVFFYDFN
jgi:hypothetical protein